MKYNKYDKKESYSYAFGMFPCLELIKSKKTKVLSIIFHEKLEENEEKQFLIDYAKQNNIEIVNNSKLCETLSKKENCFVVLVFEKYVDKIENGNHIVLVNPQDAGNLGTIIRTMLGFGMKNLAIIDEKEHSVDIFNPKTIRASMGSAFKINIEYFNSFDEYEKKYDNEKYAFCLDGDKYLQETLVSKNPYSLIFGNEAEGLPSTITNKCNKIKIKQSSEIDSFNLAISVGMSIYHFSNL